MSNYQYYTKVSRDFRDVASDLLNSNLKTFETAINFFRSFCNENEVIQEILAPIKENEFNTDEWYSNATAAKSSMVGSGDATLPHNKLDALKVIYDLLWNPDALNTLLHLGHATMFKKNYDEQIKVVNSNIINFFVRYVIRELEEKVELVKPQSSQNVTHWTVNAPSNIATHSQQVRQELTVNNPEIHQAIADLRTAIIQSELSHLEQSDALETVDMIEEETVKQNVSPGKVNKLLNLLPSIDNISSIASNIGSFFQ